MSRITSRINNGSLVERVISGLKESMHRAMIIRVVLRWLDTCYILNVELFVLIFASRTVRYSAAGLVHSITPTR